MWKRRQGITLELASEFLKRSKKRKVAFEPVGVAQGWSPLSYASAARQLLRMGYKRIAIGGLVPLRTPEVLDSLAAVDAVRRDTTQIHLLGITRCENVEEFARRGVTSFDSTSPFRQSFKDDRDNYYVLNRSYMALRVPQVDGNPKLKAKIRAGQIEQGIALSLERDCLVSLRRYDAGKISIRTVLRALRAYEEVWDGVRDRSNAYEETLEARPWSRCKCGICADAGIDVALFRGSERNKRTGIP